MIFVGTALVAVRLKFRTGIHPEGFILKDKPCPYEVQSSITGFSTHPIDVGSPGCSRIICRLL